MLRLGLLLAMVIVAMVGLAQAAEHASPRKLAKDQGSGAADGVFPRTVRHQMGETQIAQPPLRVAVVSTGQIDAMVTLGLTPAGATRDDSGTLYADYLVRAYPERAAGFARTADLGGRSAPDLEALAALNPDLILMNRAVLKQDVYALYSRIAPTVVTRGNGVNWKTDFVLLADAVGKAHAARAWLDQFHAEADRFARGLPAQNQPTVSFVQANGARIRIMGTRSFGGGIAEDLGLARPPSQRFTRNAQELSNELVDQADADWVFYAARGKGLTDGPLWPRLRAVQTQHALRVEHDPFYLNAGPTAARIVQQTLMQAVNRSNSSNNNGTQTAEQTNPTPKK